MKLLSKRGRNQVLKDFRRLQSVNSGRVQEKDRRPLNRALTGLIKVPVNGRAVFMIIQLLLKEWHIQPDSLCIRNQIFSRNLLLIGNDKVMHLPEFALVMVYGNDKATPVTQICPSYLIYQ